MKAYQEEFRRDVIAVARKGKTRGGRSRRTSASPSPAWPAGCGSRTATTASPLLRRGQRKRWSRPSCGKRKSGPGSSSRRTRSSAGQPRNLPSPSSRNDVPAGPRTGRRPDSGHGGLPGAGPHEAGVLSLARRPRVQAGLGRRTPDQRSDRRRDDPTFGYRFVANDLHAAALWLSGPRVWRLCSQQRLSSLHAKKRGLNRKAGPSVHDNPLRRAFTAPDRNKLWRTNITEHSTAKGKLYLCAVEDSCSRRIVGCSVGNRMRSALAVTALRLAVQRRNASGTVVHSDRGSQVVPSGPAFNGVVEDSRRRSVDRRLPPLRRLRRRT